MLFLVGFGWAKPVPSTSTTSQTDGRAHFRIVGRDHCQYPLCFCSTVVFRLFSTHSSGIVAVLVYYVVQINVTLAALNLIPIPPLDGSKILMGVASGRVQYFLARLEPYGFFIIIGLLYLGILDFLIAFFRGIITTMIGILLP